VGLVFGYRTLDRRRSGQEGRLIYGYNITAFFLSRSLELWRDKLSRLLPL
jgi:hypothetical protein